MRTRREGWNPLPAVASLLSPMLLLCGCRSADTRPDTVQAAARPHSATAGETSGKISLTDERDDTPAMDAKPARATGSVQQVGAFAEFPQTDAAKLESPSSPSKTASVPAEPVRMTLDVAIAVANDRNPTLVALRAGEPVAQAIREVSQTYPFNPFVQIQVLPYARDPQGNRLAVQNYVWLMQTLELAHQQRFREASATAALNQVRWNIVQAELMSAAQTERLYFTAIYQRDLRDLARHANALNDNLLEVVERRFKAGSGTPAEQTAARVSARQTRKQAELAEANYQTAVLALRRQLNLSADEPIALIGRLEDFAWRPIDGMESTPADAAGGIRVPKEIAEPLANERPDVLAAQAGTNVAQANADLARANTLQNLQLGPFYQHDEFGTLFFGFRTQMNLPIWDNGRPLARQRESEFQQQYTTLDQLRQRAQVEVETAVDRYERARRIAERERSDFSKIASDEISRVKRQFEADTTNATNILNVFAVQNSLIQEHRAYLDLLNELALAASDVTLAAGLPPVRVVSEQAAQAPAPPAP